jgi:hypothetical protein
MIAAAKLHFSPGQPCKMLAILHRVPQNGGPAVEFGRPSVILLLLCHAPVLFSFVIKRAEVLVQATVPLLSYFRTQAG